MATLLVSLAEAVMLAAILLAPWAFGGAPDPARYALCALLLAAVALWAAARAIQREALPWVALPAGAWVAASLASLAWSPARVAALESTLVLSAMLGVLVFWSDRARERRAAWRLTAAVLATCVAQAVFGAVQWSLGADRIYGRLISNPFGSFVNHNHFAALAEMGIVLAAGLGLVWWRHEGPGPRALGYAGVALALVAAQVASRSRGGLVALVAGLFALGLLTRRRSSPRRDLLWMAGGAVGLLAFALAVVPSETRQHLGSIFAGPRDSSGAYRATVAQATVRLALASPLVGSGLGSYADAITAYKRSHGELRVTHAESDLLEFVAEAGLLGCLFAGWLAVVVVRGWMDRRHHSRDRIRNALASAALAAAAAVAVHSLFDFGLRLPAVALVFASLVGLAAAPRSEPSRGGSVIAWSGAALVALALAAASGWRTAGALWLDRSLAQRDPHTRLGVLSRTLERHRYLDVAWRERARTRVALAQGSVAAATRLQRAAEDLQRALVLRPRWGEAWADLAWVRFQQKDTAGATAGFARAMDLDPTHVGIGAARADFLYRTQGVAAAVGELARLRGLNPNWSADEAARLAARWTSDEALLARLRTAAAR